MNIRGCGVKTGFDDQRPAFFKFSLKVSQAYDLGGTAGNFFEGFLRCHNEVGDEKIGTDTTFIK